MKRTPWTERKFEFDLPVGVLPNILERLIGTPARLEELIRSLPPDILTVRVDGKWSIQEHAGHLWDLEELHEGRIDDYLRRTGVLRAADMKNEKTFKANHNLSSIRTILSSFRTTRERFVKRIGSLDDTTMAFAAVHPRLKQRMRPVDLSYFVAEHDDHHLTSIRELSLRSNNKGILTSKF